MSVIKWNPDWDTAFWKMKVEAGDEGLTKPETFLVQLLHRLVEGKIPTAEEVIEQTNRIFNRFEQ
jgi:hypothetical protein